MLVNLTPHIISEVVSGLKIQPFGTVARVSVTKTSVGNLEGCPLFTTETGEVTNLPDAQDSVWYIVSAQVRMALPERKDLLSPGDLVRDDEGRPIGCNGFNRN